MLNPSLGRQDNILLRNPPERYLWKLNGSGRFIRVHVKIDSFFFGIFHQCSAVAWRGFFVILFWERCTILFSIMICCLTGRGCAFLAKGRKTRNNFLVLTILLPVFIFEGKQAAKAVVMYKQVTHSWRARLIVNNHYALRNDSSYTENKSSKTIRILQCFHWTNPTTRTCRFHECWIAAT